MRSRRTSHGLWALGATAFSMFLAVPSLAAAATLHVTDPDDGSPPAATLRNQIAAAASGDTVVIDVNPTLIFGEIAIDKNLTIRGHGAGQTTISADETSRIFNVGFVTPGVTVAIERLTITAARSSSGANAGPGLDGSSGANGGAIINSATLTITNSTLSGNASGAGGSSFGSGIDGGNGGRGGSGGAISNSATLTITNSTLSGNASGAGGAGGDADFGDGGNGGSGGSGGAISNSGTLTTTNSTLSGNTAGAGGSGGFGGWGGLAGHGGSGGSGGAISNAGTLMIASSTLSGNAFGTGLGGIPGGSGTGGGAFSASGAASIANSIFAANSDGCAGSFTDGGHNIAFPTVGGCPATFGSGDPKLDPAGLAENGGPTQTIALLSGSAAIDQIPSGCPAADQRGFSRPAGICDIGAFEVQPANDTDGDGVLNVPPNDQCPSGAGPGTDTDGDGCKDGGEDPDDDNDTVADGFDNCSQGETGWASSPATDQDADGCRDAGEDSDDDNDTVADSADQCPTGAATGVDTDADGCRDAGEDADDDDDGVPDASDSCPTTPGASSNGGCPTDLTAPQTTIVKTRINQEKRKATFRFSSSEPNSSFRCKLDNRRYKGCSSPKTYRRLKPGRHKLQVGASDAFGNADPTPTVKRFRIRR